MGKYQEVEVKYFLCNKEQVLVNINQMGLKHNVENEIQNDSYYIPAHRNFFETEIVSEWLRIRETEINCTLNFKQWLPIGSKEQDYCNEYETVVGDLFALKKIFELLDFKEIVRVCKVRNSWIYDDVEICIDEVENLGTFIELEILHKVEEGQISFIQEKFGKILKSIAAEVGKRDRRGYPYMILEKNKLEERENVF